MESVGGPSAHHPWLRVPGLTVAVLLYLAAAVLVWYDHQNHITADRASLPQVVAPAVAVLLAAGALTLAWEGVPAGPISPAGVVGLLSVAGSA